MNNSDEDISATARQCLTIIDIGPHLRPDPTSTVVTPKFSPVAVDAPAPASFAAVVAAPAPAREHKSS